MGQLKLYGLVCVTLTFGIALGTGVWHLIAGML